LRARLFRDPIDLRAAAFERVVFRGRTVRVPRLRLGRLVERSVVSENISLSFLNIAMEVSLVVPGT
jgi:hypothetical protein